MIHGSFRLPRHLMISSVERVALANWLLVWVGLANLGFIALYPVGFPSRGLHIVVIGLLGIIVRGMPVTVQAIAFVVGLAYAAVSVVSNLFNLPIYSLSQSIKFMDDLNLLNSREYMALGLGSLGLIVVACLALRRPSNFTDWRTTLLALCVVASAALADAYVANDLPGHYKRFPSEDAPFSSALTTSAFLPTEVGPPRHLLLVMVESLGLPTENAELQRLIFARYNDPAVRSRFDVSTGVTTYYGSTTAGEIRELCGRWGEYHDLVDRRDANCVPARLARQGFETSAYHSFAGEFFERNRWYRNIGFDNQFFRSDLIKGGAKECGGVFEGACDRDVPRQLAQRLKFADRPQFIYWLTVNTHLPVPERNNLGTEDCARISPKLAVEFPMICRQVAIWDAIDRAIAKEAIAADFPPTDILIVGDHIPPYLHRKSRAQFAPDMVPWLLLKWRGV